MPFIQTRDNQSIYVRDLGPKSPTSKPPIFLLHGFGMQSAHWLPFALPLATKYRFIIPDFRGFGRSHINSHNQDCVISNYADDLADIIEHFGFDEIKLAGISMGAFVALQYQSIYGDQHISRYLHIDQSPRCLNDKDWRWGLFGHEQENRLDRARTLIAELNPFIQNKSPYSDLPRELRERLWENLGDFFASALSKPAHKKLAQRICNQETIIKHLMPVTNWPVYIHCLKAYMEQGYDMRSIIEKLSAPMSLMVGLKSEMYPCGGQLRIADYHANCEIITLDNSGHTPLIDQPIRFLKELNRFASAV
jgi:pimeloyl-ACP methyl ester carboxylesterase